MNLKSRVLLALLLFSLLGATGYSQSSGSSETFDPVMLESMHPVHIGKCKMSNGSEAYCELYESSKTKFLLALYIIHDDDLILVVVKEMDKDGRNQRNLWLHEIMYI